MMFDFSDVTSEAMRASRYVSARAATVVSRL